MNDRVLFALCAAAGGLIVVGCLLPTFEVGLGASVGAGSQQQAYEFDRTVHAATYGEAGALLFVVAGSALIAAGIAGLLGRAATWLIPLVCAVTVVAFVQTVRTIDYLRWDDVGVFVCQQEDLEDCIGYLAPAVGSLRAEILRRPIGREPEFNPPGTREYKTRGLLGWRLVGSSVAVFSFVAWFRTLFLITGSARRSALLLVATVFIILVVLALRVLSNLE